MENSDSFDRYLIVALVIARTVMLIPNPLLAGADADADTLPLPADADADTSPLLADADAEASPLISRLRMQTNFGV